MNWKSTSVPFTVAQFSATKLQKKIKKEKLSWNDLHADGSVYVYYLKSDSTGKIKGIKEEMYKKEKKERINEPRENLVKQNWS